MGYFLRYVVTDPAPVDLRAVGVALEVDDDTLEARFEPEGGVLLRRGTPIAEFELTTPDDDLFAEEIEELAEFASAGEGRGKADVLETLASARAIVAVQVLSPDASADGSLAALEPAWHWLFEHREGLLQADGEGWHDAESLILEAD